MSKERLTKREKCRLSHGEEIVICNHDERDCNDSCMKIRHCEWYRKAMEKLKVYEDLEEQNLLLRLPVAVGDTLYTNQRMKGWFFKMKDAPYRVQVEFIEINNAEEMDGGFFNVSFGNHGYMMLFNFSDIGKTIFLTKKEAEEKLRELESEDE